MKRVSKSSKTKTFTLESGILHEKDKPVVFKVTDAYGNVIDSLSTDTVRPGYYILTADMDKSGSLVIKYNLVLKVEGSTIFANHFNGHLTACHILARATEDVVKQFMTVKDQELTEKI